MNNTNLILLIGALVASAIVIGLSRIKQVWLRVSCVTLFVTLGIFALHGIAVSWERLNQYSSFTARYREVVSSLRQAADASKLDALKAAVVEFDEKTKASPQSAATLQEAAQSLQNQVATAIDNESN